MQVEVIHTQEQALHLLSVHTNILVLKAHLISISLVSHQYPCHSISTFQVHLAHFLLAHWFQRLEQAQYREH